MESQIVLFSDEENAPDDPPAASTALAAASLGVGAAVILGSRGRLEFARFAQSSVLLVHLMKALS